MTTTATPPKGVIHPRPKLQKRSAERNEFLTHIVTTAVEGGIGYWSRASRYRWGTDDGPFMLRGANPYSWCLLQYDAGPWTDVANEGYPRKVRPSLDPTKGVWAILDADAIAHAFHLLRKDTDNKLVCAEVRQSLLAASASNESGDIDAIAADLLVQLGLLGDVVFG